MGGALVGPAAALLLGDETTLVRMVAFYPVLAGAMTSIVGGSGLAEMEATARRNIRVLSVVSVIAFIIVGVEAGVAGLWPLRGVVPVTAVEVAALTAGASGLGLIGARSLGPDRGWILPVAGVIPLVMVRTLRPISPVEAEMSGAPADAVVTLVGLALVVVGVVVYATAPLLEAEMD